LDRAGEETCADKEEDEEEEEDDAADEAALASMNCP